jgi:hypothetical protein
MTVYVSRVHLNASQKTAVRTLGGRILALQAQPVVHQQMRPVVTKPFRLHIAVRFVGVTKEQNGTERAGATNDTVRGQREVRSSRFKGPSNSSEPVTSVVVRGKEYYHAKGLLA